MFKSVSSKVALDAAAATQAAKDADARKTARVPKAEEEAKLEAMRQRYLARKKRGARA